MASTPREIGTLIVVVLKANHLPNKRRITKQDPYCVVTVNGEKKRTKSIPRGGQHPEWDEEIRFTLYEDVEDELARTANGDDTPPPPPPKNGKASKKVNIRGGKTMLIACYADDPREPDLIGEGKVDLTEVLTKGETDEWFNLTYKDRFAGKVYLELTFWSNAPAPEKKAASKPSKNKHYGGPGSFVPLGEDSSGQHQHSRVASASVYSHSRPPSESASSLRPSSSLAGLDLYTPAYEQTGQYSAIDSITNDFGQLGVSQPQRSESYPPTSYSYGQDTTQFPLQEPSGYDQGPSNAYPYDTPTNQPAHHHRHSMSGPRPSYLSQDPYQPSYESTYRKTSRGPRYSIPATSSGFAPLNGSSGFAPAPSHTPLPPDLSGFVSHTPAPGMYNPSHFNSVPSGFPAPSHTPVPGYGSTPMPLSSSFAPFPPSQSYSYPPYAPPGSVPPPQQSYLPPPPPGSVPPQPNSTPPQPYNNYSQESPNGPPGSNASFSSSLSSSFGPGSRPLPQQPQQRPFVNGPPANEIQGIPPPPPLPHQSTPESLPSPHSPQSYSPERNQHLPTPPPPPAPPHSHSPRRQSSLPQPPTNHPPLPQPPVNHLPLPIPPSNSTSYRPPPSSSYLPPPPPPPPLDFQNNPPPPPSAHYDSQSLYNPGLPPKPPALPGETGQWPPPPPPPLPPVQQQWN